MGLLDGELADIIGDAFADIFLDATLSRDGANTGPAYDPTPGTPVSYACKAISEDYYTGTTGRDLVGATDMKVLILATSLAVEPKPLDRISIPAQGFSGVVYGGNDGLKAVSTDPAKATWQCRVVT